MGVLRAVGLTAVAWAVCFAGTWLAVVTLGEGAVR